MDDRPLPQQVSLVTLEFMVCDLIYLSLNGILADEMVRCPQLLRHWSKFR